MSSKPDDPEAEKVLERVIEAREAHQQRCAQIEAGDAEPWVYDALKTAYATLGAI